MKYIIVLLLLSITLFAKVPDVVSVAWLKSHYHDANLVIIDVRETKIYKKSHLKNAVSVPVFEKLFYGKHMLIPPLSKLRKLFSEAGINDKSEIVVYGGINPIWSARFYWISKVLGANNIGILKVSYGNWKAGQLPISKKIFVPVYQNFTPQINNSFLKTKLDVLTSLKNATIVDGRPHDFYVGKESHARRYGHILNAINLPGSLTYSKNGLKSSVKDFDALKPLYKKLDKKKPIILYCEDGADAAMNFLVLKNLGYNVSIYDGSWLEWGNDTSLPIENHHKEK
jgi:thiosulfate/3-mercaptopyruvate sulfurtransferase